MSNYVCAVDSCPVILSSTCVIYQGESLIYTGINDGDSVQTALQKIDAAFADAGLGYAFQNGVIQTTPGVPVELGGALLHDTTIGGNYKLTLAGRIQASALITTGGTSSQFVKGDGSLDSTAYQVAGNYITALTGDGTASGPGSAVLTLATVNANPGTYGSATLIPRVTVDAKGRVTDITTTAVPIPSGILVFEGDVTGSGTTGAPVTLTLATVNTNVYNSITFLKFKVNGKGLVTGASPVTNLDIEGALGYVPVPNSRTITINGITQSLQANRTWTLPVGVASVTATAPLSSTGGADPNISITKADATTDGYLDNVDWVTFNAKQAALNGTGFVKATGTTISYDNTTYTPTSRTLTINGTSYDLSADRSWTINSMVYPGAGIAVSTGTAWGTSIVDNSTNWNTAYTERISSASAPLSIASNAISISQASGSSNGYLSSGDWTTFNNKEGSITAGTTSQYWRGDKTWQTLDTTAVPEGSNLYYTDARVRAALSVSAPLTYSSTTGEFGITKADASTNGYLSSTDWNTFNNKQPAAHYITDLTGEATGAGPGIATVTLSTPAVTGKLLTGVNITGGTVLDTDSILVAVGKLQNQINGLIGGSIYEGTWNASTNTPTLTSGVGTDGHYYIVNVAGNTNLNGITDWHVGDWAIFHDGIWQKVDNTDAVISVNGYTGAVSLVSSDVPEGATNLYFTNTRARQAISLTTTGSSGAATYNDGTGVLNIPNYNPDLSGYVPTSRTLTINGTPFDLSADRSWSVGTVTSVAQLTIGTTGTDITSSVATGTTTPIITLNVPTASATNRGALSSTDWSTFNSKQAALSGTGFVKIVGTTISYDNSTYLTTSSAASTYVPYTGATQVVNLGNNNIEINGTTAYVRVQGGGASGFISESAGAKMQLTPTTLFLTEKQSSPNYTKTLTFRGAVLAANYDIIVPDASGTLALTSQIVTYTLPIATASVLGGVKIGGGVSIDAGGVISVSTNYQAPLSGTGFVKSTAGTISYDTNTYLTTTAAAATYPTLTGGNASGTWNIDISGYANQVSGTTAAGSEKNLLYQGIADNDIFRLRVGGASNAGWVEIATADDGTEPIYVRQYTGPFTTIARTATILDASGNTSFPGTVTAPTFSGNATTATNSTQLNGYAFTSYAYRLSGVGYYQINDWVQVNTNTGLYWPNHYGLHFYPNNDGSYGSAQILGDKNGWRGLHFGGSTGITLMMNEAEFGFHRQAVGWVARFTSGIGYFDISGSAGSVAWGNVSSKPSNIMYYQGFTLDANTMDSNSTGFTYSVNAPYTGPVARFSTGGGYDLWLNAQYGGNGTAIAYRTRNGDAGTFNSWHRLYSDVYRPYADSAGSVAWGNISSRPDWMTTASLIAGLSNANSQVNSGFYENGGGGSNWPSQTWYNSINVRHSNQANYHGFQVAMSYYDNLLWFRSYQGSGTFQSWVYAISSANIGSQSVNYATSSGNSATTSQRDFNYLRVNSNNNLYLDHNYGCSIVGVYSSFRYQGVFSMGDAYKLAIDGSSPGNLYGMSWSHPNAGGQAGYLNDHGLLVMVNGVTYSALSSNIWARGRITATSDVYSEGGWFYSYNNAGWYNNTYGQGLRQAKGNVTYGNVINVGENFNGWAGYNAQNNHTTAFMQNSAGTHGFYQESGDGWTAFYNKGNQCWGLGTDATDPGYSLHIIKYGGSNTGWIIWSDRRIKENIKTIDNALDKVLSLRGVYYNKIDDPNKERCVGYIAQEVMEVVPELVVYSEELDMYNMNYGPMVAMLTEAVKEQQAQIEELKQQVQTLLNS